jgi:T-complex protein 1 subunit zeta
MSIRVLNPNAEVLNKSAALHMTINAAKGLQDVLKSNLGPKGTIKMYFKSLSLCDCNHLF